MLCVDSFKFDHFYDKVGLQSSGSWFFKSPAFKVEGLIPIRNYLALPTKYCRVLESVRESSYECRKSGTRLAWTKILQVGCNCCSIVGGLRFS